MDIGYNALYIFYWCQRQHPNLNSRRAAVDHCILEQHHQFQDRNVLQHNNCITAPSAITSFFCVVSDSKDGADVAICEKYKNEKCKIEISFESIQPKYQDSSFLPPSKPYSQSCLQATHTTG